jgi:hypothetical protein
MTPARDRIRTLNDELRQHHRGGLIVLTPGVQALGAELIQQINESASRFDSFTPDNDSRPAGLISPSRVQSSLLLISLRSCGSLLATGPLRREPPTFLALVHLGR